MSSNDAPLPSGTYTIKNVATQTVIDLSWERGGAYNAVIGWPAKSSDNANQHWTITNVGGNNYNIMCVATGTFMQPLQSTPGASAAYAHGQAVNQPKAFVSLIITPLTDGVYSIGFSSSEIEGYLFNQWDAGKNTYAPITLEPPKATDAHQQWQMTPG